MRYVQRGLFASALLAAVLGLTLTGCGDTKPRKMTGNADPYEKDNSGGGAPVAAAKQKQAIPATDPGVLKGTIKVEGKLDLAALTAAYRAGITKDRDYCLQGKESETTAQDFRIGDNGGVGNVYVWIEPENARDNYFEVADEVVKALPKEVTVDQPHCAFLPHCSVVFSRRYAKGKLEPTGQKLQVVNSASVAHNTKVAGGPRNPEKNETLGSKAHIDIDLVPENEPVNLACSIHPWMKAYVRVFSHPYATVSRAPDDAKAGDYGSYEIKGVPTGASVRVFAWHEKAGYLGAEKDKGKVIKLDKTTPLDFTLAAK